MNKPYKNRRDVTYEMIRLHPYFRTLTSRGLGTVISYMDFGGYRRLQGVTNDEKTDNLIKYFKTNKMATTSIKVPTKGAKKKAVPEKQAVKPLTEYSGYNLDRRGSTVRFGCGAVTVQVTDLQAAAEILSDPKAKKGIQALRRLHEAAGSYRSFQQILDIKPEIYRRLAAVTKKPNC